MMARKIIIIIVLSMLNTVAWSYSFTSNVDSSATVESARRILEENGGVFIGPERITEIFGVANINLPNRLPFQEREIFDCLSRYGACVLFPTVSSVSYRKASTSIQSLSRSSQARQNLSTTSSRSNPWFKNEPFSTEALRNGWHLISLNVKNAGTPWKRKSFYRGSEGMAKTNVYYWMLLLLPREKLVGRYFYSSDLVHRNRNAVYLGKPRPGLVKIYFAPVDIGTREIGFLPEMK